MLPPLPHVKPDCHFLSGLYPVSESAPPGVCHVPSLRRSERRTRCSDHGARGANLHVQHQFNGGVAALHPRCAASGGRHAFSPQRGAAGVLACVLRPCNSTVAAPAATGPLGTCSIHPHKGGPAHQGVVVRCAPTDQHGAMVAPRPGHACPGCTNSAAMLTSPRPLAHHRRSLRCASVLLAQAARCCQGYTHRVQHGATPPPRPPPFAAPAAVSPQAGCKAPAHNEDVVVGCVATHHVSCGGPQPQVLPQPPPRPPQCWVMRDQTPLAHHRQAHRRWCAAVLSPQAVCWARHGRASPCAWPSLHKVVRLAARHQERDVVAV